MSQTVRSVHVVRNHNGGWSVKDAGSSEPLASTATQREAIDLAWEHAQEIEADLVIHRRDGSFREVKSVGESRGNDRAGAAGKGSSEMSEQIGVEDVVSVGSRVSWAALLAGAVISLTVYVTLGILGVAIGLSVTPYIEGQEFAIGAAVWAAMTLIVSLFIGGFVTSQSTVGEKKGEAMIYGTLLWGILFIGLVFLNGGGLDLGFGGLLNRVQAASIDNVSDSASADRVAAAWWTFGGLVLSLITAMLGALAGAGPNLVLRRVRGTRRAVVRTETNTA